MVTVSFEVGQGEQLTLKCDLWIMEFWRCDCHHSIGHRYQLHTAAATTLSRNLPVLFEALLAITLKPMLPTTRGGCRYVVVFIRLTT